MATEQSLDSIDEQERLRRFRLARRFVIAFGIAVFTCILIAVWVLIEGLRAIVAIREISTWSVVSYCLVAIVSAIGFYLFSVAMEAYRHPYVAPPYR